MLKTILFCFLAGLGSFSTLQAQETKEAPVDSSLYYDELFDELGDFMDSLTAAKSFLTVSVGFGNNYLNYKSSSNTSLQSSRRFMYSPSVGYFSKSGLGFNAAALVVNDGNGLNAYQAGLTASYDYLESRATAIGFSYTRFFTKDSLSFYTSPLQNEFFLYASYRKSWLRPVLAASYGWGSRTEVEQRETLLRRLRRVNFTETSTEERINDFTVTASVKHDFYWLHVLGNKDYFRLTPQLSLVSGTQRFGFNQTSNSYVGNKKTGVNVLYNSQNVQLDDRKKFQPLSVAAFLKSEFSLGKFFLQPQLVFDYYLPAAEKSFTTTFNVNTGFTF